MPEQIGNKKKGGPPLLGKKGGGKRNKHNRAPPVAKVKKKIRVLPDRKGKKKTLFPGGIDAPREEKGFF